MKNIREKFRFKVIINVMLLSMIPLFYVNCGAHNFQKGFETVNNSDGNGSLIFLKTDINKDNVVDAADMSLFNTYFVSNNPKGDFNLDGVVDYLDLGLLKQDYCTFENLDINADGAIDFYDLQIVQNSTSDSYNNCYDINKDGQINQVDINYYLEVGINTL